MGGTLFHSREFTMMAYVGIDGCQHHKVVTVDGDSSNLSHASWGEIKALAEAHGMPRIVWPEFLEHDFGIDVPLAEVRAKQDDFRHHLLRLSPVIVAQHLWLARIVKWVQRGEAVFFCGN